MRDLVLVFTFLLSLCFCMPPLEAATPPIKLKDNLTQAKAKDYIVTSQSNNYTLLLVYEKSPVSLTLEEVTIPASKIPKNVSWRQWFQQGAPGNTSWVRYVINLQTGSIDRYFSFTKNAWGNMSQADNFLSTLLNLPLYYIPPAERKRVGSNESNAPMNWRPLWQPKIVIEGHQVDGITFDAWRTCWPNDGSQLAGKDIEIYTPEKNDLYPAYFPYWLQISGMIGQAKVRIVDSGMDLTSPRPALL